EEDQYKSTKEVIKGGKTEHFSNIEALHQLYLENVVTFVVPWNKLYRRCLFKGIEYTVGIINDDETVIHKLLYYSKKTTYLRMGLYFYVQRKNSQVNAPFNLNKLGAVYALKQREVFFREKKEHALHQKALKRYMEKFLWYYSLTKSTLTDVDSELKALKKTFNQSLRYLLKHNEIGWKQKCMCIIFWMHPPMYEFIKNEVYKREKKQHTSA
ncbi:hypothetical protein ACLIBH_02145, partial [Virgibacillus sp. W0430]|uniref:hypothetical protein n=1 Tax=Virgibacillus sp. W0430 TaxID=3391580 RepID=UPI003F469C5F